MVVRLNFAMEAGSLNINRKRAAAGKTSNGSRGDRTFAVRTSALRRVYCMDPVRLLPLLILAAALSGCSDLLVGPDESKTPEDLFDLVWAETDRYYSHFPVKDVDWDEIYDQYRPLVSAETSDEALFTILCEMLQQLKDGHVNLLSGDNTCSYTGWYSDFPANFNAEAVRSVYLAGDYDTAGDDRITFGRLTDTVGYIHINSFADAHWFAAIDDVLKSLDDAAAMIIDVRHNGGGSSRSAAEIAGRFADESRLYAHVQYRNGPRRDDLTAPQQKHLQPAGEVQFPGPVAVLTNRRCFSACEDFALAMQELPNADIMGEITGGGFGNAVFRELPNGWVYRIPVWIQSDKNGNFREDVGVIPDFRIRISSSHLAAGRDTILERALDRLQLRLDNGPRDDS